MKTTRHSIPTRRQVGFTLIELLTVIVIIGILAGIVVSGANYASRLMKVKRVTAALEKLQTAILDYKAKTGSFPPDNIVRCDQPSLYYELVGMVSTNGTIYITADGRDTLTPAQIAANFGVGGINNAARTAGSAKKFLPNIGASEHRQPPGGPVGIEYLVAPVKGTNLNDPLFNPWRYVSRNPTNNPKGFDLWTEVILSGNTPTIIGNWK